MRFEIVSLPRIAALARKLLHRGNMRIMSSKIFFNILCVFAFCGTAYAAGADTALQMPNIPFLIGKIVVSLGVLVGVIYAAKRWAGRYLSLPVVSSSKAEGPHTPLKIESRIYLGPKAGLYLIRAGAKLILISVDAAGVKKLDEVAV